MGINIITWFNEEKRCFDQWTWEFDEWTLDWYSLSIMWSPNLLVSWWSVLDPSHAKHWEFVFLRTDKNQHFDQNMAICFFFGAKKTQGKARSPWYTRDWSLWWTCLDLRQMCLRGSSVGTIWRHVLRGANFFRVILVDLICQMSVFIGESGWNSKTSAFVGKILLNNSLVSIGYTSISPSG